MTHQIERICLSVNSVCNLACSYCYFFAIPEALPGPESLSADEIETILNCAHRYSQRPEAHKRIKINFVGSGEPLLSWKEIRTALLHFQRVTPVHRLRFYTVTNGILLNQRIAAEMKELGLTPSISLDGPQELHDHYRKKHGGQGSFHQVMRGIEVLRAEGFTVAINTVLTRELLRHLPEFLSFAKEQQLQKIIFDRLVDVPAEHNPLTYAEFYRALRHIAEVIEAMGLSSLEIGNLEAYRRAIQGQADRVCTMFGSTCGAGLENLMYMQRDVYPCGRMFHQEHWRLGRFDEDLENFPVRMKERLTRSRAGELRSVGEGVAGSDCIIEQERADYDPRAREEFVAWFTQWMQRNPAQKPTGQSPIPTWEDDELPDMEVSNRLAETLLSSELVPALRLTQPRRSPPQT